MPHTGRPKPTTGPPATASDYVTKSIRAEILAGTSPLGSRLDQEELARRFGVSVIPVREGLKRLEAEGLVRMPPRRGAFVAELSLRELTEISWIRERLEDLAVRQAAGKITDRDFRGLEEINERMSRMARGVRPAVWNRLDRDWHFGLYAAGDAAFLLQFIATLGTARPSTANASISVARRGTPR